MFEELDTTTSFPEREQHVLTFWRDASIFSRSLEQTKEGTLFSFYDGPPFATGLPHYGHILAGTIKDVVQRYKTMKGFFVPRRFGWDCHGLPVENEIEKTRNLTGAAAIERFGIANFNEACREIVLRYAEEWKTIVERMGRWVEFDRTWHTMDPPFMESVWWVFSQLYAKGLVYEGYKVMPYSAKLGTPLSNFEAGENYQEVDDPSLTVTFPLKDDPNTSLVCWTTTPWTLISNLAVIAHPDTVYVIAQDIHSHRRYILAESRLEVYFKHREEVEVVGRLTGRELAGRSYVPLFSHFDKMRSQGAFQVITDDFVTTEEGSGLVHAAPGFGENDFYACQKQGIPVVCPIDQNGQFTSEVPEYEGRFVKECDKEIIRHLKEQGRVLRHETLRHRYPFCWRSDTPLIYRAVSTWFVAVEQIKEKLLRANAAIYWMPEHIKEGRFGKWLEGARDWAISRNRYWGTPIPIWRAPDGERIVIGSLDALEQHTGTRLHDLHRHFVDPLTITKDGKVFTRVPEVFDCWFESGSVPYAQYHYPFEHTREFATTFPADFIAEGLDQTRGWFYTLTVIASALFDKPAFKNVVVNGIVLAEDGQKMSKRLKNYPDPQDMLDLYGADAIRLYMLASSAVKGEDFCFSRSGLELVLRQVLIPLWNAQNFFTTYARLYAFCPDGDARHFRPKAKIDRWILSLLEKLIHDVEGAMDRYDLSQSVQPFVHFVDQLTNWYIRQSRRRFWNDEASLDRKEAFQTLYIVLKELVKVTAPYVPFISEAIFRSLRFPHDPDSVHLVRYPEYVEALREKHLEELMDRVQVVTNLGHSLRKENRIKVRQPLATAYIVSRDQTLLKLLAEDPHLIADELNVRDVRFEADESPYVTLRPKPNFRVLGKRLGARMKQAHGVIEALPQQELAALMDGGSVTIRLDGEEIVLSEGEVHVEREVKEGIVAANMGPITVALDVQLNPELVAQGISREIVNKVNLMRKDQGLEISDRIHLIFNTTDAIRQAIERHREFISGEVLALSMTFGPCEGTEWDINGEPTTILVKKA